MKQQHKNSLLALAIFCGLLSLPMTWLTIRDAQIQSGFGEMFNSAFGGITIDVTGLNGHLTFLVKTPIWFIVLLAIAASSLQLMWDRRRLLSLVRQNGALLVLRSVGSGLLLSSPCFRARHHLVLGHCLG